MGWWILLGVAAFIGLLLFAPVSLFLSYREEESAAWLKILWLFKIPLMPAPERPNPEAFGVPSMERCKEQGTIPDMVGRSHPRAGAGPPVLVTGLAAGDREKS